MREYLCLRQLRRRVSQLVPTEGVAFQVAPALFRIYTRPCTSERERRATSDTVAFFLSAVTQRLAARLTESS